MIRFRPSVASLTGRLLAATALCGTVHAGVARADDTGAQIGSIEKQIRALQSQLSHMKHDLATRNEEVRAARQEAAEASRTARENDARMAGYAERFNQYNGRLAALSAPPGLTPNTLPKGSPYVNVDGTPYKTRGPALKQGQFQVGGVRVTLGGFIEAAGIYRSRNETADIASSFNTGIPFPNSANYHQSEFRGSARQSRLSILAEGTPNDHTRLSAYYEMDFNSAGASSNSNESNSYTFRERQLYATYERSDWDFYVMGGQAWSLLTMNKAGIKLRQEDTPLTIDAQYVPGFVWTRNVGLRIVKGFMHDKFDLGLAVESPESTYSVPGTNYPTGTTINTSNPGLQGNGSTFSSGQTYSTEYAPDVIVKGTADPGWGHYELFGIARFLHDRVSVVGSGASHTRLAGGGGAGMILPLIKGKLDLQASFLAGEGIGRYGSAQLADATTGIDGSPEPLPEVMALAGLIWHPTKMLDFYSYVGTEQVTHREDFRIGRNGFGYGNPLYSNAGCDIELSAATCTGNTSGIVQGTIGGWWRFLKGDFGTLQSGVQYSYTKRAVWSGVGGNPTTDNNIVMFSFRYLPFQ
jgi:TolA-binding protein